MRPHPTDLPPGRDALRNGPTAFWFVNDRPLLPVARQQLKALASQGFTGVVIHPRDGLWTPYLSQSWFELLESLMALAGEMGLDLWFYDENPFPSGTAGGRLLDRRPALAAQVLEHEVRIARPRDGRIRETFPKARGLVAIHAQAITLDGASGASEAGPWIDITAHAGIVGDGWTVRGPQDRPYGPDYDEARCQRHWRSYVHQESWVVDWQPPREGDYRILAIWRQAGTDSRHGFFVDQIHPDMGRLFIDMTYQETLDKLGADKFRQFRSAFIDEPRLCHAYPWTDDLPEVYQQRHHRDLLADLPLVLMGDGDEARAARHRYRTLLADLWIERFWQPLKAWCARHDIPLTGHLSPEEDPVQQHITTPGWTRITGMMDWPGCDQITSLMGIDDQAYRSLGPKLTSSLAHQRGGQRVMVEAMGVTGEGITLGRMRRMIDWLAICGCDTFVIHGQYMSLAGHRKREAPPSIFVQQPYWPFMHQLSDHIRQWGDWQQATRPHRPVALLYPSAAFYALGQHERPLASQCAIHLGEVVSTLMREGIDFDLVADHDLATATITPSTSGKGSIRVGQAVYDTLVVPDIPWTDDATLARLKSIASQSPASLQVLLTRPLVAVDTGQSWQAAPDSRRTLPLLMVGLIRRHRQWLSIDTPGQAAYVHSRRRGQVIERTIWNPSGQPLGLTVHHEGASQPMSLPGWAVARCLLPQGQPMTWSIAPAIDHTDHESADVLKPVPVGRWQMQPEHPNTLRLGHWTLTRGSAPAQSISDMPMTTHAWRESPDDVPSDGFETSCETSDPNLLSKAAAVSGASGVQFETSFHLPDGPMTLTLVLDREALGGKAQVMLNDHALPIDEATPSTIYADALQLDVTDSLQPGSNRLSVRFAPGIYEQCPLRDPFYLAGDFLVQQQEGGQAALRHPGAAATVAVDEDLDWAKRGYPHYSGVMRYESVIELAEPAERLVVELAGVQDDPLEVLVDGQSIGVAYCFPARLVCDQPLAAGSHTLACRVANTRINYTEGVPQPSGLLARPAVKVVIASGQPA